MQDKIELKPCPFCGGKAKLERSATAVAVACEDCDAEILRTSGTAMSLRPRDRVRGDVLVLC